MHHRQTLLSMKFKINQLVEFETMGGKQFGRIEVADWVGSVEHDYHSYDIYVRENNMLHKHVPEDKISRADSTLGGHTQWHENQKVGFEAYGKGTSEWVNYTGTIITKRWNEEIKEYIYDIEVIIDYDTGKTELFEGVFFEYLMARL